MIAYVAFAIIVLIAGLGWLMWQMHKTIIDDDWMEILTVNREKPGLPEGFTTKAKCPECGSEGTEGSPRINGELRRHFLRAAEPEGDLIECSRDDSHWWVRGIDRRQNETGSTEEPL